MTKKIMAAFPRWIIVIPVCLQACINPAATSRAKVNITPAGWYSGDIHVHRNCGEGTPFVSESRISEMMEENDLDLTVLLADMGNGEVANPQTDLLKVNGKDAPEGTTDRIIHWDAEWHWDANYANYPHRALGGHIILLGMDSARQLWEESPYKILEWGKKRGALTGFVHLQYMADTIKNQLTCCRPVDLPAEAALGTIDFVTEDVYSTLSEKRRMSSEVVTEVYYKLLNCGFRLSLTAGTDYPCNNDEPLGSLLTYVYSEGGLTYDKWITGIKKGNTVVSRVGNHEFLDIKINKKYKPGDEIAIDKPGMMQVDVSWLADSEEKGVVEIIMNGKVAVSKKGSSKPGKPMVVSLTIPASQSSWIAARRMKNSEHVTHTGPVYITMNNTPVQDKADAGYFIGWIDNTLEKIKPGGEWHYFFPTNYDSIRARYLQAREVYAKIGENRNK